MVPAKACTRVGVGDTGWPGELTDVCQGQDKRVVLRWQWGLVDGAGG